MCVAVTLLPGAKISDKEIYQMGMTNGDGAGVAWVAGGTVHWYKTVGYKVSTIQKLLTDHEGSPRLLHFRLATVGGVRADLCHPFAIDSRATCEAVGTAPKVMMHNGHFSRWRELLDLMDKEDLLPDRGPWSDTRLVAFLAFDDMEWLEVLGGRVATLDGAGQLTHMGDWSDLRDGVRVSNKHWDREIDAKVGGYTGYKKWQGWDETWGDKTWQKTESKDGKESTAGSETHQAQGGQGSGQEVHRANPGHVGPGGGVHHQGQEGSRNALASPGSGSRAIPGAGDTGVPVGGGAWRPDGAEPGEVRQYSTRPWKNPVTGACYQAGPDGRVVKIAPDAVPEVKALPSRGDAGAGHSGGGYVGGADHRSPVPGPGAAAHTVTTEEDEDPKLDEEAYEAWLAMYGVPPYGGGGEG